MVVSKTMTAVQITLTLALEVSFSLSNKVFLCHDFTFNNQYHAKEDRQRGTERKKKVALG